MRTATLRHMLRALAMLALAILAIQRPAAADWPSNPWVNVAISRLSNLEQHPRIVSDGADGAIIVWDYQDIAPYGTDLRAQRVSASGALMWSGGVDVCAAYTNQRDHQVISDGAGGIIVAWCDERGGPTTPDIYAQRLDAAGNKLWGIDGTPICTASDVQAYPQLVSDGAGGAIITWRDSRNYSYLGVDIYAQRANSLGAPQWGPNGKAVCAAAGNQLEPIITSSIDGGVVIAWMDYRNAETGSDVYAQRLNSSGAPQWAPDGVGYLAYSNQFWYGLNNPIASDGTGGAIIVWNDDYFGVEDIDIRALRVDVNGNFPWSPANVWVCGSNGIQKIGHIASDGTGNLVIPWQDYRWSTADPDIYAQKLDASGAGHWAGWGAPICTDGSPQSDPKAAMDDAGGAIISWTDDRYGTSDIFAQRADQYGTQVWTTNGVEICTASNHQHSPVIARAGGCGAIVAWTDYRWLGTGDDTSWDIYAQRVYCNGYLQDRWIVVDVPNGGQSWLAGTHHEISWHGDGIDNRDVLIQYSHDGGASFEFVAYHTNHGTSGSFDWEVPESPSTQCLVRLYVPGQPEAEDVSDAFFTILPSIGVAEDRPLPERVMLEQCYPNPTRGEVSIPFGLPRAGFATLSVYDVRGRLVRVVTSGPREAGWHHVRWDRTSANGMRVGSGIYYLELRTEGQALTRKTVVLD